MIYKFNQTKNNNKLKLCKKTIYKIKNRYRYK